MPVTSYAASAAAPTSSGRGDGYSFACRDNCAIRTIRAMKTQHFFADVDLPFHVWVREGDRWVLREAPQARDPSNAPAQAVPARAIVKRGAERRAG